MKKKNEENEEETKIIREKKKVFSYFSHLLTFERNNFHAKLHAMFVCARGHSQTQPNEEKNVIFFIILGAKKTASFLFETTK